MTRTYANKTSHLFIIKNNDPTQILYSTAIIFMLESSKIFGISIKIIFGGFMNNQNDNKSNALFAVIHIVLPLLLSILLPTFVIVGMKKWMSDEVQYPSIISLLTLCIGFFIVGILFSLVLHLCKLSEEKLKELGFLGFTLSAVSTFLTFYVGYFWLANLNFTSVELSPHAVLVFAIACTLLLESIFKVMDMFDNSNENQANL